MISCIAQQPHVKVLLLCVRVYVCVWRLTNLEQGRLPGPNSNHNAHSVRVPGRDHRGPSQQQVVLDPQDIQLSLKMWLGQTGKQHCVC